MGHTHNSCDRYFGIICQKIVNQKVETPLDIVKVVGSNCSYSTTVTKIKQCMGNLPKITKICIRNTFHFNGNNDCITAFNRMVGRVTANSISADDFYVSPIKVNIVQAKLNTNICKEHTYSSEEVNALVSTVMKYVTSLESIQFYFVDLKNGLTRHFLE